MTNEATRTVIDAADFGVSANNPDNKAAMERCMDYAKSLKDGAVVMFPAGVVYTSSLKAIGLEWVFRGNGNASTAGHAAMASQEKPHD